MTKSELFKKAHAIAKATVKAVGNYSIAFKLALKEVYFEEISLSVKERMENSGTLTASQWQEVNLDPSLIRSSVVNALGDEYLGCERKRTGYIKEQVSMLVTVNFIEMFDDWFVRQYFKQDGDIALAEKILNDHCVKMYLRNDYSPEQLMEEQKLELSLKDKEQALSDTMRKWKIFSPRLDVTFPA